ncbi:VOC family protein [Salinicoccus albus]|uniref:VOC family protein n=1 Tax=Salinicoccus albus TaxID=418756 RepID=UPI00037EB0B7|nr:VOC family protein [Salinicoccus albus]
MNFHKAPATHVQHVKINVSDLERSVEFYTNTIGFKILEQDKNSASLTTDGKTSILSLYQPSHPQPKGRTSGLYHFAILLPERKDLAAITMHLARKQMRLGSADHDVSEALYMSDPDGNGIEIYIDRDPEAWTWHGDQVNMVTEPLDAEGLLKDFNPSGEWHGLPEDTVMGHLHLHVADLDSTLKFYTEGLGMNIVCKFGGQAIFMSTEDYHHHIAINLWHGADAPAPETDSVGLNTYTLKYPNAEARDAAVSRLENSGVSTADKGDSVFAQDPSGNHVELAT